MKDLEIKLENMNVPQIEDEQFEYKLRRELLDRFHQKNNSYRFRFRAAIAFSCLLLVFGCVTVLNPDVAVKINNFAFNKNEKIVPADQDCSSLENLAYTSIYNPNLKTKLDPDKFEEDKTYLVRKYVSSEEGGLMIVSEFDKKQQKKHSAKRISY